MIELYGMGSPNVVKIFIALEEMGLPYQVHPVDVFNELAGMITSHSPFRRNTISPFSVVH